MITEHEVDGVRTLYAPSAGRPRAGLMFRVGQADETLPSRGITHLVEHLALFRLNLTDYHSNGSTGSTLTHFYLEGTQTDVVDFLASVCGSLSDLPLARVERERAILQTEEAGRGNPTLPGWRYGAQGYGLVSYAEWGNERLGPDEVAEWSRTWFTKENALLWVTGPNFVDDLRLPLPSGSPRPTPHATQALPSFPTWFSGGQDEVVMDTVVERTSAAVAYAGVLGRELFRTLRQEGGWSYQVGAQYDPRDGTHATVTAYADAHTGQDDAVLGAFVDTLAKLRAGRIEEADVQAGRNQAEGRLSDPDVDALRLPSEAADLLWGRVTESVEQLREEALAVTVADVHAVAQAAHTQMLLKVPDGRDAEWTGFATAPLHSAEAVQGRRFAAIGRPESAVVVGPAGVTLVADGRPVTVRFDQCAAMLRWPDGRRVLIGRDAFTVTVEPTLFADCAEALAVIDAGIDRRLTIARPARSPEDIPSPPPPAERGRLDRALSPLHRQSRRRPVPDGAQPAAETPGPETTAEIVPPAAAWLSLPAFQGDVGTGSAASPGLRSTSVPIPEARKAPEPPPGGAMTVISLLAVLALLIAIVSVISLALSWPGGGADGSLVRDAWFSCLILTWTSWGLDKLAKRRRQGDQEEVA